MLFAAVTEPINIPNTILAISALVGAIGSVVATIVGLMNRSTISAVSGDVNAVSAKTDELHRTVNSQLDAFKQATAEQERLLREAAVVVARLEAEKVAVAVATSVAKVESDKHVAAAKVSDERIADLEKRLAFEIGKQIPVPIVVPAPAVVDESLPPPGTH